MDLTPRINNLILNKRIENLKQSLQDIFHDEPYIYTALALQSMGFTDEQILEYVSDETKNHNEFNDLKLEEFKNRNSIDNNINVSNRTSEPIN